MRRWSKLMLVVLVAWLAAMARAQDAAPALKLPAIFGDNMVLQQGIPVPVWGWAEAGKPVTVTFKDQKKTATAGQDGKWMVKLDALQAGGPFEMTVEGGSKIAYQNVLVGEVWICSGQSNMEFTLRGAHNAKEAVAASANPTLRMFTVRKANKDAPQTDCIGKWEESKPETSPNFSAVGYFFGLTLQKELKVPIGLIHTSWGGTPIEVWLDNATIAATPGLAPQAADFQKQMDAYRAAQAAYADKVKAWEAEKAAAEKAGQPIPVKPAQPRQPGMAPACLWNGMINPLIPYGIAGATWYQGESNAGAALNYRKQMPAMIQGWRKAWGQGDFGFYMVSLANFMARKDQPADSQWAELREAQALTALNTPKTGIGLAIDVGDAKDIHPKDKQTVGNRLALSALAIQYGKQIEYSGPWYDSMKVEGDKVRLKFKHVGGGLVAKGEKLTGFAIAGADKNFVWADAKIDGDTIVVSSAEVKEPVAVRYAWADNPDCNLYNKDGLPAVPFRTDDWMRAGAR